MGFCKKPDLPAHVPAKQPEAKPETRVEDTLVIAASASQDTQATEKEETHGSPSPCKATATATSEASLSGGSAQCTALVSAEGKSVSAKAEVTVLPTEPLQKDMCAAEPQQDTRAAEPPEKADVEPPEQEFAVELTDLEAHLFQQMADGEREAVARANEAEERACRLERLLSRVLQQHPASSNTQQADMVQAMLKRPGTEDLEALSELLEIEPPAAPKHRPQIDATITKLADQKPVDGCNNQAPPKVPEQAPPIQARIMGQAKPGDQAVPEPVKVPEQALSQASIKSPGASTAAGKHHGAGETGRPSSHGASQSPAPTAASTGKHHGAG